MLIRDRMTKGVITVEPGVSMMQASRLMKDHNIHRLPVVDENGKLVGILSDRDVKEASPSKATALDMHEIYYLLSEIKVKDIMTRHPLSMRGDDSVEQAALLMIDKQFSGIPIVDDNGKVEGIITDSDIFKVFVDITGASAGGLQLTFGLSRAPGSLRAVLDALREHGARLVSVLTSYTDDETRTVYVRIAEMEIAKQKGIIADLQKRFNLLYWHPKV